MHCIDARRIIGRLEMSSIRRNGEVVPYPRFTRSAQARSYRDEFTRRVNVSGVDRRLRKHVQADLAEVLEPPVAEELYGPPGGAASRGVAVMMAFARSICCRYTSKTASTVTSGSAPPHS